MSTVRAPGPHLQGVPIDACCCEILQRASDCRFKVGSAGGDRLIADLRSAGRRTNDCYFKAWSAGGERWIAD